MKTKKQNTTTALPRLFEAVRDIVQGMRGVYADVAPDKLHAELRVPVLFQGSDMRVTIEAGPSVAMRNAMEHAQMKASDKPVNEPGVSARGEAITLLAMYASEIRDSSTTGGHFDFDTPDDEQFFNRVVCAMKALDLPDGVAKAGAES